MAHSRECTLATFCLIANVDNCGILFAGEVFLEESGGFGFTLFLRMSLPSLAPSTELGVNTAKKLEGAHLAFLRGIMRRRGAFLIFGFKVGLRAPTFSLLAEK